MRSHFRLRLRLRLRREVEVVLGFDAFVVAEHFDEFGVEVGDGVHHAPEVGFDEGDQVFGAEIELWEPAAGAEPDPADGIELDGEAVDVHGLLFKEAAEFADLALGCGEMIRAAHEEAGAVVIGHDDDVGVVLGIEFEARKDPVGVALAFVGPIHGPKDGFNGIEGLGGGVLHYPESSHRG